MADDEIHPFSLQIPQEELDDLHRRLDRTRWPDEIEGAGWDYGIPLGYVRELARYWRHEFDWRAAESRLNEWPQFTTTIDGANIHFAHIRSPEPDALPVIMTHGWPGSIVEFLNVVGPLTDPRAHGGDPADAVHLVLPSLPGFAMSGPTTSRGWEFQRTALAWSELMSRLGYGQYGAQGGDWGAFVSRELGRIRPDAVIGVHLTMLAGASRQHAPTQDELDSVSPDERERILSSWARQQWFGDGEKGYSKLQATKPQTLSYSLTDSPVGQLAWIAEKFKAWTDCVDRPEEAVDRDEMLTNITIYWLTATAGSSARYYYERMHTSESGLDALPSSVPTGVANFPAEVVRAERDLAERSNVIVHWTTFDRGGHFPAMEQPDALVEDIRAFFRKVR